MQRRVGVVLLAIFGLLMGGANFAQAVDSPNAPINVSAISNSATNSLSTAGSLSVTWQKPVVDSTHPIPIAYIVTATAGTQTVSVTVPLATVATTDYSTVLTGLTGGTAYAVTVTSRSSENTTATSAAVTATPITSPTLPTPISAVASPGSIALTWSAPGNNGGSAITSYLIRNGTTGDTLTVDSTATTRTIAGLASGSSIIFSIRAKNANGDSEFIAFAVATLPTSPEKPTGVTAISNTSSISVSWVAPTVTGNSAITGYKVYLYDSAGVAIDTPTSTSTLSVELTNVSAGTYTVKVKASNLVGDSIFSDASLPATIAPPSALQDNSPVFNPSTLPNLVIGATQNVSVTIPSAESVTVIATGTPTGACTYSAGVLTAVAQGTCSVRATSPATATFAEAIGTKTFSITKTLQTITFPAIANQPLPGPLTVTASSTSALAVAFAASGNCTLSGTTVSFASQGTCTVTASQAGNSSFAAANQVSRTFSIIAAASSGNSSNVGAGGGSSSGGGLAPGPTPEVLPSPSASPSASAVPTPSASPSASAVPTPSASPSASPKSVTPTSAAAKPSGFVIGGKVSGVIKPSTLTAGNSKVEIKLTTNFQAVIPTAKKGEKVLMTFKGPKGKTYTAPLITVTKAGSVRLPPVKFSVPGKYLITIKVGSKVKIVTLIVTK